MRWLRAHRPPDQRTNLRKGLGRFAELVARNPALGEQVDVRGTRSYRVFPIGGRLPYLIWYYYDTARDDAPVWLAMLLHEAQDRERFSPGRFE